VAAAVLAADDARLDAMARMDVDALAPILADELVFVHTNGHQDDKPAYLDALRSGRLRYRALTRREPSVRVAGNTAILTGMLTIEATVRGEDHTAQARFLSVWTKDGSRWRMLAADMVRAAER